MKLSSLSLGTFSFSSSLKWCAMQLTANAQKAPAEQLEMIRSSALSFDNLKVRKRYYQSLETEIIDILQAVPPEKLTKLQSEKLEVHFKRLLKISLISSQILHDNPERIYPEHQLFFAALVCQLIKLGQSEKALQFERSFQEGSWKQRAALKGIAAARIKRI